MKFASFDTLSQPQKQAALLHIKERPERRKEDYLLALHALLDADSQIRLTAKLVANLFSRESYFIEVKGLDQEELRKRIENSFQELAGSRPEIVERGQPGDPAVFARNLQIKAKRAEMVEEWDGPFPRSANLLNTLREDTQELITSFLKADEKVEQAFLAAINDSLKPFRECRRSLDSNTATAVVNLSHLQFDLAQYPNIEAMFGMLERAIYLLIILSNQRLIFFLRDEIKHSRGAWQGIPFAMIKRATMQQNQRGPILEIETEGDLFKIPWLQQADAMELDRLLRERSVDSIQADETFIDRDFDKETKRVEMLYKAKTLSSSEYIFRKQRLQKMELEKFSDKNLEALLAKRFSDSAIGAKIDEQLLKKFSSEKTIMFTDIVGYSKKAAEKELLDTMTLLAVHDKMLMPIISNFGGLLIKKIGDALMVKFDDPLAACTAGKEMQTTLIRFNRTSPEKILIRIGLNTGTVFIKNDDVFGDAVNVAARMEAMAQPGMIFLTERTFQGLAGRMPCHDFGFKTVKGQKTPMHVFTLVDETNADREMLEQAREFRQAMGVAGDEPEAPSPAPQAFQPSTVPPLESPARSAGGDASSPEAAASSMEPSGPIPFPDPQTCTTPAEAMETMGRAIDLAIGSYKAAVRLGQPRDGVIEGWFNGFVKAAQRKG